eukprot:447211-Amphidinium_carterae.4
MAVTLASQLPCIDVWLNIVWLTACETLLKTRCCKQKNCQVIQGCALSLPSSLGPAYLAEALVMHAPAEQPTAGMAKQPSLHAPWLCRTKTGSKIDDYPAENSESFKTSVACTHQTSRQWFFILGFVHLQAPGRKQGSSRARGLGPASGPNYHNGCMKGKNTICNKPRAELSIQTRSLTAARRGSLLHERSIVLEGHISLATNSAEPTNPRCYLCSTVEPLTARGCYLLLPARGMLLDDPL